MRRMALVGVTGVVLMGCHADGDAGSSPVDGGLFEAGPFDASPFDAGGGDASDAADATALDASADASDDASAEAGTALVGFQATSGWQVYPSGSYHYGPSIVVDTDASIHMWTCSPGTGVAWDYIRYQRSVDDGHTWSADTVALQPTAGTMDAYSTCDPGAVKIGAYWYVGYTSTTNVNGTANHVFVARSGSPTGPFEKWSGTGWGNDPKPIVIYSGAATYYGFGEPSLVLVGKKLFVYYSDNQATTYTNVAVVDDATVDDWPLHLVDHGHAIVRNRNAQDSADVKYDDALGLFVAVTTYERFSANASVATYQSSDGLTFIPSPFAGARVQIGAHNVGISGDPSGHIGAGATSFVAYAYQPVGNGWGNWPTYLDPVSIGPTSFGIPVAGAVSSIVAGNDWNWSGPRAWDGDPNTVYSSDSHGGTDVGTEWITIDVGAPTLLRGVTLVPRSSGVGFPIDFAIQTSLDSATWTDVPGQSQTSFANPGGNPVVLTFATPSQARYVRLNASRLGADEAGNHYLQLAEITAQRAP